MEKEVIIKQTVNASRERVWKAWTDPKELAQWWGPNNVTIPECVVDLQIGGKFYIVMEAGEAMGPYKGTRWPMLAEFTVIEPNSKLSYSAKAWTEGQKDETMIDQATDVSFFDEDGKTKIEVRAVVYKTGPKAAMAVEGMQAGFTQQLEKLNSFLSSKK